MKISFAAKPLWVTVLRILFLVVAVFFGWWSLRGEWPAVVAALGQVTAPQLIFAMALVLLGLTCTGFVWQRVLHGFGHNLPSIPGLALFFLGQLGKYIPGSVWSLAAQSQMARRFGVPVRTTVATGLIFLYWNVSSAALLSSLLIMLRQAPVEVPVWASAGSAILATLAMTPNAVTFLATGLAGSKNPYHGRWSESALISVLMLFTWSAYGLAVVVIVPKGQTTEAPEPTITAAIVSFVIAFILGILVPFTPAGFGIREGALIFLLTPTLGLASSAAVALLTRVVHLLADFWIAAMAWVLARFDPSRSPKES